MGAAARDTVLYGRLAMDRLNPISPLRQLPNMLSSHVAIEHQALGPSLTITTPGIAGLQAIIEGAGLIAGGEATVVLAGGAEDPLTLGNRAMLEAARPGVAGPELAEGAAVLVLESAGAARRRGASIQARVVTGASSSLVDLPTLCRQVEEAAGWLPGAQVIYGSGLAGSELARDHRVIDSSAWTGRLLAAAGALDAALAAHHIATGNRALVAGIGPTGVAAAMALETPETGG